MVLVTVFASLIVLSSNLLFCMLHYFTSILVLFSVTVLMSGQQICLQKSWRIFMPGKLCLLLAAYRFVPFKMHEKFFLTRN